MWTALCKSARIMMVRGWGTTSGRLKKRATARMWTAIDPRAIATKCRVDRGFRAGSSSSSGRALTEMSTGDIGWPILGRFLGDRSCCCKGFGYRGGVFLDFGQDIEGDFQSGHRLLTGHSGTAPGGDRVEEVLQLQTQGLVFHYGERGEVNCHGRFHAIADAVLAPVTDRNIFVGLKEPQFRDALCGN